MAGAMQKSVTTTKKLLGALAIIGLMSVVLAKFFSDLAFADDLPTPASLAGDSQYMGEYEVKTVQGNDPVTSKEGNLCVQADPAQPSHSIDPNCGKKVWVYRSSEGKLVLIKAVDANGQLNDQIFSFAATDTTHLVGSLLAAQKSGVFSPGVIAQAQLDKPVGGTIGKVVAEIDVIAQPFFAFGAVTTTVSIVGNTIQVREVLRSRAMLGLINADVDKTAILTPVTD
jgi:hypothetical protein